MQQTVIACVLIAALWIPAGAQASEASERYAEKLVRTVYFEGIPYEEARGVDAAGAARLVEMLWDPDEKATHAKILIVLGMSQRAGTFETLVAYSENAKSGEMDRPQFHAWRVLPTAMGHLVRSDPRALQWLEKQVQNPGPMHRTYRHHDLAELRLQGAVHGLGVSGEEKAAALLRELRDAGGARRSARNGDEVLRGRIDAALALHDRIARDGPGEIGLPETSR